MSTKASFFFLFYYTQLKVLKGVKNAKVSIFFTLLRRNEGSVFFIFFTLNKGFEKYVKNTVLSFFFKKERVSLKNTDIF